MQIGNTRLLDGEYFFDIKEKIGHFEGLVERLQ